MTLARMSLAVAAGSAIGGVLRFWMTTWASAAMPHALPLGTIAVNIIGSCAIGVIAALISNSPGALGGTVGHHFLMAGVLGGFTTFSAFSVQTLVLLQQGQWGWAAANVALSLALCLGAVWIGWALAVRV
jgi:CrcB protein